MRDAGLSRFGNALVVGALGVAALAWLASVDGLRGPDVGVSRWIAAAIAVLLYAALCGEAVVRARRRHRPATVADEGTILVAFATQTGFAQELAAQTAAALEAAGRRTSLRPLAQVDTAALEATRLAFFVVATYGDGEPPDAARRFARDVMGRTGSLASLRFAVLALGDRSYARFCGFGHNLAQALSGQGAQALFTPIEVDNGAGDALAAWHERLRPWTGSATTPLAAFASWTLTGREPANAGSVGAPMFHLTLEAPAGERADWRAGDIAIVRLPDGQPREYSIASLPSDRRVELLVRRATRPDGRIGLGAQWLTSTLAVGATTGLRIRANHGFRLAGVDPATPLILVGNGTGIAGLRAHLKARVAEGATRNWLFFGERHAAVDRPYGDELDAWSRSGALERVTWAFSRDGAQRVHVQDRIREERAAVAEWLAAGAIVLVCGSANGMAGGVDAVLGEIVGTAVLEELADAGRYRRDVY